MSGHKMATVTISQEEYRKLYEAEKTQQYNLESSPEFIRGLQDSIQTNTIQEVNQVLFQNYSGLAETMGDSIARVENQMSIFVHEVNQQRMLSSQNLIESKKDTSDEIKVLESRMNKKLADLVDQNASLSINLQAVERDRTERINYIVQQTEDNLSAGQKIFDYVQSSYPTILLDENYLTHISMVELDIQENIHSAAYEAALATSQDFLRRLSVYRSMLDVIYVDWFSKYQQVVNQCVQINNNLFQHQSFQPVTIEGETLDRQEDTNFWSHNIYRSLWDEFKSITDRINSDDTPLTSQELNEFQSFVLPDFLRRLSDCVSSARFEMVSSQLRYQLANRVLFALVQQGFKPVEGNYANQDYRKGYFAKARSVDGDEIVIEITPGEEDICQNQVELISLDSKLRTETELIQRANEIRNSILSPELNVTQFSEIVDPSQQSHSNSSLKVKKNYSDIGS
jgi:hypothetical protein